MPMIFHPGDPDGEFGRYTVICKPVGKKLTEIVRGLYDGSDEVPVSVFACGVEAAKLVAVDKLQDKWYRHSNMKTQWTALRSFED